MSRDQILKGGKIVVSLTCLGLLLWQFPVSLEEIGATLRSVRPLILAAVLVLLFVQYVVSSAKWRTILLSHDIRLPLPTLVQSYLVGNFFSSFLPSSYMGDLVRVADVGRASGRTYESASSVALERLSGLAALSLVGSVASAYIAAEFAEPMFRLLALLFAGIVLLLAGGFLPGVIEVFERVARRLPVAAARRAAGKVAGAVRGYRRQPGLLLRVMGWSFLFQILAYNIFFLYGRTIGLDLPYLYCFAFVPVIYLLEALPLSVAGIGLRESGLVFFLTRVGFTSSEAIALGILLVCCRYLASLSGGLLYVLRGGGLPTAERATATAASAPAEADAEERRAP